MCYVVYFQSNNIILTEAPPTRDGVGCLEGGPRPRPVTSEGKKKYLGIVSMRVEKHCYLQYAVVG